MTTIAIELKMRGVRTSIRWIPGHEGIEGNKLANEAAGELNRSFLPRFECNSEAPVSFRAPMDQPQAPQMQPHSENETGGLYDPFWEIKAAKKALKIKIDKHRDAERESLPKEFRRYATVLL